MRQILFILICLNVLTAQSDPLAMKFQERLGSLTKQLDGIAGYVITDLRSGEHYTSLPDETFPTASSIKVFILAEVYRQAAEGKFSLNDIRPLPASARVGGSGVLAMLGERSVSMSIRDYCVLMINLSDNSATNFLIGLVGMKPVNDLAAALGCRSTKLQRIMMDVAAAKAGRENISTPADLALMMQKLYNGEVVSKQASEDMLSILSLDKEGALRSGVPAGVTLANKGGDIDGVRCDAGVVYLEDAPYVICVMTKMLRNAEDGVAAITGISKETYQFLERTANSNVYGRRVPK